jgi:hypothetical protein
MQWGRCALEQGRLCRDIKANTGMPKLLRGNDLPHAIKSRGVGSGTVSDAACPVVPFGVLNAGGW